MSGDAEGDSVGCIISPFCSEVVADGGELAGGKAIIGQTELLSVERGVSLRGVEAASQRALV